MTNSSLLIREFAQPWVMLRFGQYVGSKENPKWVRTVFLDLSIAASERC